MGADGGSIPRREELVKTKAKQVKHENALLSSFLWYYCALSKEPLQAPVVSCCLGRLYNREAVIQYLLDRSAFGDVKEICGHIKSLKDVRTLILTHSTSAPSLTLVRPQYACPLTNLEMNGGHQFIYIRTCGHVMSSTGLKESTTTGPLCPICTDTYDPILDVIQLNPPQDKMAQLLEVHTSAVKRGKRKKVTKSPREVSCKKAKLISTGP